MEITYLLAVQIHAKIKLMEAGRLLAVLNMSPSTTSKGPSTTSKGDMLHVTPSIYTLVWGQVATHDSISTRHTNTLQQTILTSVEDAIGCQDCLDTSIRTPYMSVVLADRMTKEKSAHNTYDYV